MRVAILILFFCFINFVSIYAQQRKQHSLLSKGFASPPDSVKPYVYYYWMNDHVSSKGVIKDFEAMKEVGIGGAFIGNIGLRPEEGTTYGNVKLFSEEWWKATEMALSYASKNGIALGMFNSPGWSQSGGPWVKAQESMRYVNAEGKLVDGSQLLSMNVFPKNTDTGYLSTMAFPAPLHLDFDIRSYHPVLSSTTPIKGISQLMDGSFETQVSLVGTSPENKSQTIDLSFTNPLTARSIVLHPIINPFKTDVMLQVFENGSYRTLRSFQLDRSNPSTQVGFMPYAPLAIAFEATTSDRYRLIFSNMEGNVGLSEIILSPATRIEHYQEKQLAKMYQSYLPLWPEYQWASQPEYSDAALSVDPKAVINLKEFIDKDGNLKWNVPAGKWVVMNYRMVSSGVMNAPASSEGRGLEIDKMNSAKLQSHFDSFIGKVLKRTPAKDRTALQYLVADSYEVGSQNWTDGMEKIFKEAYGYDPLPWLPVLSGMVVGSTDQSNRFLWDLRRLIADKVAYEYIGGLRKLANRNGMKLWLENYGHWGFPSDFLTYGGQSDEVAGEFWNEGELGNIENRSASSAAHTYGKNKVWSESFTATGNEFKRYPALLKKRGDWSFTEGVNQTLLCLYIHQPYEDKSPGVNAWFSTEFNRKNTWFKLGKAYIDYLRRCNFLLQQGRPISDVAYFIGEDAPKMTGIRDPELPQGFSYDYINAEVILNRMRIVDGQFTLPDGVSYKILVLPPLNTMSPKLLKKIAQFVEQGGVILGRPPSRAPGLQDYPNADLSVKKMASSLWGGIDVMKGIKKFGKGWVMNEISLQQAFDYLKVLPDFKTNVGNEVLFTHRSTAQEEIYFITNQSDRRIEFTGSFRTNIAAPAWWDPVSGSMRRLPVYKINGNMISIPFNLDVNQSGFVVFEKGKKETIENSSKENFPVPVKGLSIRNSWTVQFNHQQYGGPGEPVVFKALISWAKHPDERIQNYSGTAVYTTTFDVNEIDSGQNTLLSIGEIKGIAKVKLNGVEVGTVWTAPWQIDVSSALRVGTNQLEIEIVNTWVNRLIGDSKLKTEERRTWTNINNFKPDSPYEDSGLIGPVSLYSIKY